MKLKKLLPLVLGGMITVGALGGGLMVSIGNAAENKQPQSQNQTCQTEDKDGMMKHADMTNSDTDMIKQCSGGMQQPEMQNRMKEMMQQPEMQAAIKAMMQQDAQFHQMMLDLVNSVETPENHDHGAISSQPATNDDEHAKHHM